MSESEIAEAPRPVTRTGPEEAGALLRSAREAAGLHIAALAVSLKVPVKRLEALEAGRLDDLPGTVFVRALASSVCRALRIDPAPVLQGLPGSVTPELGGHDADRLPVFPGGGGPSTMATWQKILTRPLTLLVAALLCGALALFLLPFFQEPYPTKAEDSKVVPVVPAPAASKVEASNVVASKPEEAMEATGTAPPEVARGGGAVVAMAAASASVALSTPQFKSGEALHSENVLSFKTSGPSWVEVTDAQGQLALRRTLSAGEAVAVPGVPPFSVVVGKADVTEVRVRGRLLDLNALVRDNVARFEVK